MSPPTHHAYEFGRFRLDPQERLLRYDGRPLTLTPKAYDVLLALVRHPGRVLDKEELMRMVWPDSVVEEGNLAVTIFMLRRVLAEAPDGGSYIETVPRRGYRFVAPVIDRPPAEPTAPEGAEALKSIAVLPFQALGPDDRDEYLGLGMADALITRLSSLSQIRVRPTSVARQYGGGLDAQTAGRQLKVDAVLEGSIRRSGDRIRVSVQLVSVRSMEPLWAEKFDEEFTDIFAVEDSISERVATALLLRLTGEERKRLTKRPTENTEAYQLCLKGRYFFSKETEDGVKKGVEYLQQAIDIDPAYALAYAWMADSYCWLSHFYSRPREAMPKAKDAASQALALDASLAEAHTALALVRMWYDWDFPGAEAAFQQALAINPNYAVARLWYAFFLTAMGRQAEGIREIKLAHALDPLSLFVNSGVGFPFYYSRQYGPAREQAERLIEMEPHFWTGHWLLGLVCVELGEFDTASAALQKAITLSGGGAEMIAALGHGYAVAGKRQQAHRVLAELTQLADHRYVSPYHVAAIYAGLGDHQAALDRLGQAYQDRSEWLVWLKVDPRVDPLRDDLGFRQLLERVGLGS